MSSGLVTVLIDTVFPAEDRSYFECLRKTLEAGHGGTEVVVLEPGQVEGAEAGRRFFIDGDGGILASRTVGPCQRLVDRLTPFLKPLCERPRPYVLGGFAFLPHLPRCRLLVIGAGEVGQRVAELAASVDFEVCMVNDRPEFCCTNRIPSAKKLIVGTIDEALNDFRIDTNTYCVIVTQDFDHDRQALHRLVETPAAYVGMIGNRRKVTRVFEELSKEGITQESLERVQAPVGLNIGSRTSAEIAISIVAELIAVRNLGASPTSPSL